LLQLNSANDVVTAEMHRLDHNADAAFESVNGLFAEVLAAVERRREEVLAEVRRRKDEKRKVLEEQLKIIQTEKAQVDKDVEVRDRERDSLFGSAYPENTGTWSWRF
jgi:hypothetical protein